jgi:hypothetical protein
MSKIDVNGPNAHPVFAFLKEHTPPIPGAPQPRPVSAPASPPCTRVCPWLLRAGLPLPTLPLRWAGLAWPGPFRHEGRSQGGISSCTLSAGGFGAWGYTNRMRSRPASPARHPLAICWHCSSPASFPLCACCLWYAGHPANEEVNWNFNKFLLDKWGHPVKRYGPDLIQYEIETDIYNELIKPYPTEQAAR